MISIEKAMQNKYPRRVALVVCRGRKGDIDITPVTYFTNASHSPEPPTWTICLNKEHYSTRVISKTKEFTLCFPTIKQKKDVLYCGGISGYRTHKLMHCNFGLVPSKKIKAPMLKGCTSCFECKVIKKTPIYGHTLITGRVLSADVTGKGKGLYQLSHDVRRLGSG